MRMGVAPAALVVAALLALAGAQQQVPSAAGDGPPRSQQRQLLHGSLVRSARSALPDPQQAWGAPQAECEPVAVHLTGLQFWESVPVPSTLTLNCAPPSGPASQPQAVYLILYQPVTLGALNPLSHSEFVGWLPCPGSVLACRLVSNFNLGLRMAGVTTEQVVQWRPVFVGDQGAECRLNASQAGEYRVEYESCLWEAPLAVPANSSSSGGGGGGGGGGGSSFNPSIAALIGVVVFLVPWMVGGGILLHRCRAHRRETRRIGGNVELQASGWSAAAAARGDLPAMFSVGTPESSPPPPGYSGPVVVWSFGEAEEGNPHASLQRGALAVGKEEFAGQRLQLGGADATEPAAGFGASGPSSAPTEMSSVEELAPSPHTLSQPESTTHPDPQSN